MWTFKNDQDDIIKSSNLIQGKEQKYPHMKESNNYSILELLNQLNDSNDTEIFEVIIQNVNKLQADEFLPDIIFQQNHYIQILFSKLEIRKCQLYVLKLLSLLLDKSAYAQKEILEHFDILFQYIGIPEAVPYLSSIVSKLLKFDNFSHYEPTFAKNVLIQFNLLEVVHSFFMRSPSYEYIAYLLIFTTLILNNVTYQDLLNTNFNEIIIKLVPTLVSLLRPEIQSAVIYDSDICFIKVLERFWGNTMKEIIIPSLNNLLKILKWGEENDSVLFIDCLQLWLQITNRLPKTRIEYQKYIPGLIDNLISIKSFPPNTKAMALHIMANIATVENSIFKKNGFFETICKTEASLDFNEKKQFCYLFLQICIHNDLINFQNIPVIPSFSDIFYDCIEMLDINSEDEFRLMFLNALGRILDNHSGILDNLYPEEVKNALEKIQEETDGNQGSQVAAKAEKLLQSYYYISEDVTIDNLIQKSSKTAFED